MRLRVHVTGATALLVLSLLKTVLFLTLVSVCLVDLAAPRLTAADIARTRLMLQVAAAAGVGSLLCVAGAGVLILRGRALRVRALERDLAAFDASGFERTIGSSLDRSIAAQDIERLRASFGQMTERIIGKIQELRDAEDRMRNLVAETSHDLRTPLALMQGYLETLVTKNDALTAEEHREYVRVAAHHASRLQKLVAELFELAELDAPDVALNPERIRIEDLAEDVCASFQLRAREKEVDLRCVWDEELPSLLVDPRLMERVFENLIDNAIRFAPSSGGLVEVSVRRAGDAVAITVSDNGSGIAPGDLPFVFDRFYRARPAGDEKHDGAGLGLAIVRRIVELHGSTIAVESAPESGTTFRFALPVALAE